LDPFKIVGDDMRRISDVLILIAIGTPSTSFASIPTITTQDFEAIFHNLVTKLDPPRAS
jgi:hypothetical protein